MCSFLERGAAAILGKRSENSRAKRVTHQCQKCCEGSGCNLALCDGDGPISKAVPSTTPPPATTDYYRRSTALPYWYRTSDYYRQTTAPPYWYRTTNYYRQSHTPYWYGKTSAQPYWYTRDMTKAVAFDPWCMRTDYYQYYSTPSPDWDKGTSQSAEPLPSASGPISVRLVGGSSLREGRVEVSYGGEWGTVCDDIFDSRSAAVVCHMLGYPRFGAVVRGRAYFGRGSGRIWLDDLRCRGPENHILDCSHNPWGSSDCSHSEDVGVVCDTVQVRLVGGSSHSEGRLEILYNGMWGTVCDDGFTEKAASVVCHMLGLSGANARFRSTYYHNGGYMWLDEVRCSGNEASILDCQHLPWGCHDCGYSENIFVSC